MTQATAAGGTERADGGSPIKCVVWDLDRTLWDGVLLEDEHVTMREGVLETIETLDARGILNSIASRNSEADAMRRLDELGLGNYFLYPQITWNSKVSSLQVIADALRLGLDSFAFVDDDPFERGEVAFSLPEVLCIDALDASALPDLPRMQPRFITEDSRLRRQLYLNDIERDRAEREFVGATEGFLATLGMVFTVAPAGENDLRRAEELTMRTHQLNSTGYTYGYEELCGFARSEHHKLLVASLEDRFGAYGTIGLALVECADDTWTLKLLLMSCRVMARGVGGLLLLHLMQLAADAHVRFQAEFVPNDRNRMMHITYRFAGFIESERRGDVVVLEHPLDRLPQAPPYIRLRLEAALAGS